MNLYHKKRENIVESIANNFKDKFINKSGLISRNYPPDERSIIDNFDDVVPFLDYFGYSDIIFSQIDILTVDSYEKEMAVNGVLFSYKIDEYIGGLNHIFKKYRNKKSEILLNDAIKKTFKYFIYGEQFSDTYDLNLKKRSKYYSTWSAGFLETLLELEPIDKQKNVIADVSKILLAWIKSPFFVRHNLFPFRSSLFDFNFLLEEFNSKLNNFCGEVPEKLIKHPNKFKNFLYENFYLHDLKVGLNRYSKSGHWVKLMKSNTTPVFTMIEIYKLTGEDIWFQSVESWIESVLEKLIDEDYNPYEIWIQNKRKNPSLTAGFIIIDVICDAYKFIKQNNDWLDKATKIANKCLSWSWSNNLIPMAPNCEINHIDNQIDFAISIRKLGEITNNLHLKSYSFKLVEKTIELHRSDKGFYTHIYQNGKNKKLIKNTIDPKYNGLLLKGLIHLEEKDAEIYNNKYLIDLFKDR